MAPPKSKTATQVREEIEKRKAELAEKKEETKKQQTWRKLDDFSKLALYLEPQSGENGEYFLSRLFVLDKPNQPWSARCVTKENKPEKFFQFAYTTDCLSAFFCNYMWNAKTNPVQLGDFPPRFGKYPQKMDAACAAYQTIADASRFPEDYVAQRSSCAAEQQEYMDFCPKFARTVAELLFHYPEEYGSIGVVKSESYAEVLDEWLADFDEEGSAKLVEPMLKGKSDKEKLKDLKAWTKLKTGPERVARYNEASGKLSEETREKFESEVFELFLGRMMKFFWKSKTNNQWQTKHEHKFYQNDRKLSEFELKQYRQDECFLQHLEAKQGKKAVASASVPDMASALLKTAVAEATAKPPDPADTKILMSEWWEVKRKVNALLGCKHDPTFVVPKKNMVTIPILIRYTFKEADESGKMRKQTKWLDISRNPSIGQMYPWDATADERRKIDHEWGRPYGPIGNGDVLELKVMPTIGVGKRFNILTSTVSQVRRVYKAPPREKREEINHDDVVEPDSDEEPGGHSIRAQQQTLAELEENLNDWNDEDEESLQKAQKEYEARQAKRQKQAEEEQEEKLEETPAEQELAPLPSSPDVEDVGDEGSEGIDLDDTLDDVSEGMSDDD